ncbi:MAG: hypothetical protein R2939_02945 [Kofleriaceae bacterium]
MLTRTPTPFTKKSTLPRYALALPLSLLMAGAGCDDGDEPTTEDYDDVAQALGSSAADGDGGGEAGSLRAAVELSTGDMPLGFTLAADGSIVGDHLGVTYSFELTCEDADGDTLALCGSDTAAADVELAWSGQLDLPNVDASVERTGSWRLTDLDGAIAHVDGESSFNYDLELRSTFRPVTRTYMLDYAASYDAVAVADDGTLVGGSISYAVDAERTVDGTNRDVEASFSIDATLTFDGDGTGTLVLDGSHTYQVDLQTGATLAVDA